MPTPSLASRASARVFPSSSWSEISTGQLLPTSNRPGPRGTTRTPRGEGPHLLFTVSPPHANPPRAAAVEHRTEDHHLARLDPGSPVPGMTRHDLALLVAHVQRERRTG